jgi:predicted RNase H-like nuclease (RuvC/YqgF family)
MSDDIEKKEKRVEELEIEIQKLKWELADHKAVIKRLDDDLGYQRRCCRDLRRYKSMYEEIRRHAMDTWDPQLHIAQQLKKSNPRLYSQMLALYQASDSYKKAQQLRESSFMLL